MAELMSCSACGGQVADDAKACPHCGTKSFRPKKTGCGSKVLLVVFGLVILGALANGPSHKKPSTPANAKPAPVMDDFTRKWGRPPDVPEFWRESTPVGMALKSVLKDPDSLEIADMKGPYRSDEGWLVKVTYRAKNSFGGRVLEAKWAIFRQGAVVRFKEEDAYRSP